jgi:hypothetical protein
VETNQQWLMMVPTVMIMDEAGMEGQDALFIM